MAPAQNEDKDAKSPVGGRYVALLRRTQTVFLFSDPIFVADGQPLPDLPEGLQYIFIHPSAVPATGTDTKAHRMGGYMPAGALRADSTSACMSMAAKPASLPVDEYYGSFSSFLPTRDSSLSTLSTRDTAIVNIAAWSAIDADTTDSHAQLSDTDLADALQLADKVLTESATLPDMTDASGDAVLSSEVLRDLGLSPDLLGADGDESPQSTLEGSTGNGEHANEASGPESAASILETNRQLLIRLAEAQDRRAQSGDFGSIGDEEKAIASQLQTSLARAIAAHRPVAFRPPAEEIHRASQQLLAGSATNGIYSGTLPPQRRFAFISNASSHAGFPAGATTMPMERRAQPAK